MFFFDFRMYRRMLRLARHEQNAAARKRLMTTLLVVMPIVATIHAVFFALDQLFYPALRDVRVRTPVFMVGHARSGTTLAHRLLCMDPGRYSYFRLYEMFLPSLIEKKIARALGRFDRRVLGGRIDAKLREAEDKRLSATQDIHRTGLKSPEEDDFVLTCSMASGFWIVMAPYMRDLDFYYVDERPARERRRLMNFYKECVKRQLMLNGVDRIHLSKNPTFSGRVESLIETFPDARIVVLLRDPSETIPSLLKLLQTTWRGRGWGDDKINESLRVLADQSFHTYRYPLAAIARHQESPHAVVDYRDLIASPRHAVEELYRALGFEMTHEFELVLKEQEQRSRRHETAHRYSLDEFGLDPDHIRTELADLFVRYDWKEPDGDG